MRDVDLLQPALGLNSPWIVTASVFDAERRRLDITIDFIKGSRNSRTEKFAAPRWH